eukprot:403353806
MFKLHNLQSTTNRLFATPALFRPLAQAVQQPTLFSNQQAHFSEFFKEQDKKSIDKMYWKLNENKYWKSIQDKWQKPLERKKILKQKRLENPVVPKEEQETPSLYVHNEEQGVELPPNPNEIFAVVRIKGLQYKVTKDDRLMSEWLEDFEVGQQIELSEVLLVGTTDYTCVGRPTVSQAKVFATVEEHTQTEKTLIFKKRRRKGNSQRHQGHRQWVTVLKIDKIVHDVDETNVQQRTEINHLEHKPTVAIM